MLLINCCNMNHRTFYVRLFSRLPQKPLFWKRQTPFSSRHNFFLVTNIPDRRRTRAVYQSVSRRLSDGEVLAETSGKFGEGCARSVRENLGNLLLRVRVRSRWVNRFVRGHEWVVLKGRWRKWKAVLWKGKGRWLF